MMVIAGIIPVAKWLAKSSSNQMYSADYAKGLENNVV